MERERECVYVSFRGGTGLADGPGSVADFLTVRQSKTYQSSVKFCPVGPFTAQSGQQRTASRHQTYGQTQNILWKNAEFLEEKTRKRRLERQQHKAEHRRNQIAAESVKNKDHLSVD